MELTAKEGLLIEREVTKRRQPIAIDHRKHMYHVIFRKRDGGRNWNEYVEAETSEDAKELAKNYLGADSITHPDEIGSVGSWKVVEVNKI